MLLKTLRTLFPMCLNSQLTHPKEICYDNLSQPTTHIKNRTQSLLCIFWTKIMMMILYTMSIACLKLSKTFEIAELHWLLNRELPATLLEKTDPTENFDRHVTNYSTRETGCQKQPWRKGTFLALFEWADSTLQQEERETIEKFLVAIN